MKVNKYGTWKQRCPQRRTSEGVILLFHLGYQLALKEGEDTTFAFRTEDMLAHRREGLPPTREDTCFCLSTFAALRGYTDNELEMSFREINTYEVILGCS